MYWIIYIITWLYLKIVYPCKVVGKENFKKGPAIVVCNHLSNLDAVYMFSVLPYRKNYFLAKKELFSSKIKSYFYKTIGAISIDRNNIDLGAIKNSLKVLKSGKKLIIFPEGTRNRQNEELMELRNGSAMFALKAQVPIIPMHIEKRGKAFRRNKLTIGKPFELSEFYGQKTNNEILNNCSLIISEKLNELKNN